jgi:hypothetical protein
MKKQCVNNKALTIGTKIICPTAATLQTPSCINPITYLIGEALITAKKNNTAVDVEITNLLTAGVSISNTGRFCCPGCNDIYYLGYANTFTSTLSSLIPGLTCCFNYIGDPALLQTYPSLKTLDCCATNFIDCITAINQDLTDSSYTFTGSLLEYNSINSESSICLIYNQLKAFDKYLTGDELGVILEAIFTAGVVVKCDNCSVYIGSATDYFNTFLD